MILHGAIVGDPLQPPALGWLALEGDRIVEVGEGRPPERPALGGPDTLISPGFIDAHLHLPQFEVIGYDGWDLLDWLHEVVFPAESRWADAACSAAQIDRAHEHLLASGTLGYAGYLTSHPHGLGCLAQSLRRFRLRATAGTVLMDRAGPSDLINQPVEPPRPFPDGRLNVSVNPRFAVSCSDGLLRTAAGMAGKLLPIQTHLAESQRECELVRELFPEHPHMTAVYDAAGLLTPRTMLAHAIHLSDDEWRLIASRGSAVVHCPTANTFLRSGLFDLDRAREHGVNVAIGSDVAAGPDLAMPRIARAMIETAKVRRMTIAPEAHVPTPGEAWSMMTRGNAEALGWEDAGRIEAGAAADLLLIRPPFEINAHVLSRLIYTWGDEYITERIVAGTPASRLG